MYIFKFLNFILIDMYFNIFFNKRIMTYKVIVSFILGIQYFNTSLTVRPPVMPSNVTL